MIDPGLSHRPVHPLLWGIVGVMVAAELLFSAVEAGLLGPALGRMQAFTLFAFWDSLFEAARSGQAFHAQVVWTPVTHAFLHAGWLHLAMNAAAFLGLGHMISSHAGIGALLRLFVASAVAGALLYGLISDFWGPMVGASGVVFGCLGLITSWQEQALRRRGLDRSPIWARIVGLVAINALLDLAMGGLLAWEAHLGGFLAGWVMAYSLRPRRPRAAW